MPTLQDYMNAGDDAIGYAYEAYIEEMWERHMEEGYEQYMNYLDSLERVYELHRCT